MIDPSNKVATPAKLDWSKPVRRTERYPLDSKITYEVIKVYEDRVLIVLSYPAGHKVASWYELNGCFQNVPHPMWENIPEEEWIILYRTKGQKEWHGAYTVYISREKALESVTAYYADYDTRVIRLNDGYSEPVQ